MSKRAIMKRFGCDEAIYNRARMLWLRENAAHCLVLGTRFENMSWDSIGHYVEAAAKEIHHPTRDSDVANG
jgi:hypothetical protein